jgi:protein-tyrosine phosphatase
MNASANEIIKGLWLGDMYAATDKEFITKNKIKAIVNCTPDVPKKFKYLGIDYFQVPVEDNLKQKEIDKMKLFIPQAINFIHKHRDELGNNVLVHCVAGKQRSAAITAAYLSYYKNKSLNEVINYILKRRPLAWHNGTAVNFEESLTFYT